MNIGQLVEDLYCYGWPEGRTLTPQEREGVIEFALPFEECSYKQEELAAMNDKDLVQAAYWIMAEYAGGQI